MHAKSLIEPEVGKADDYPGNEPCRCDNRYEPNENLRYGHERGVNAGSFENRITLACMASLFKLRRAIRPHADDTSTALYGIRYLFSDKKDLGACPSNARPWSVREARKVQALAELTAEVRIFEHLISLFLPLG